MDFVDFILLAIQIILGVDGVDPFRAWNSTASLAFCHVGTQVIRKPIGRAMILTYVLQKRINVEIRVIRVI